MGFVDRARAPHALIINIIGFTLLGVMMIAFALALYMELGGGGLKAVGPAPVVISVVGLIHSGVFQCDPGCVDVTPKGRLHSFSAMVAAIPMVFAPMATSPWLGRKLKAFSLASGALIGVVSMANMFHRFKPCEGAFQRLGMEIALLWVEVISFRILTYD